MNVDSAWMDLASLGLDLDSERPDLDIVGQDLDSDGQDLESDRLDLDAERLDLDTERQDLDSGVEILTLRGWILLLGDRIWIFCGSRLCALGSHMNPTLLDRMMTSCCDWIAM